MREKHKYCRNDGPEAVGAVADGVAESEIFQEGEDGDEGGGDGDGPGGSEEDDGDDDGDEDECGEDALPSHRNEDPFEWKTKRLVTGNKDSREEDARGCPGENEEKKSGTVQQ